MSGIWEDERKEIEAQHAEIERMLLRFEAATAQSLGIDIFEPGWRDKYIAHQSERDVENAELDRLIATPHIDDAITGMEGQFDAS